MGTRHMCASCHYLATTAAFEILEAGGNAIDAGVCAGVVLGVVESAYVSVGGVAPIMIYLANSAEAITISGLGTWPRAASCEYFHRHHDGSLPKGILRTVVPSAIDAWLTALMRYGTMSFREVAAAAIRFARDGFVMYALMADTIAATGDDIASWPASAAIYLPDGAPPKIGQRFVQSDLGRSLQYLADEESTAAARGRAGALQAARDAFYRGDIAAAIAQYHAENGGLLTRQDLSEFHVDVEPALHGRFRDIDIFACGPWCQGPMLLEQLAILDGIDLRALGHNSAGYVHVLTEAIKLAAADREAHFGDPKFVDVPLKMLLSPDYAAQRRTMIDPSRAAPGLPSAGGTSSIQLDTSYVAVVDRQGNAFSATPSDGITSGPVVPGTGLLISPRGAQSWTDPRHPSAIMPGKRPRLTPNPAIAIRAGEFVMPFGTPGHDTQTQVMLQTFLNIVLFGMDLQQAVEAPRFCSLSFPSSAWPHVNHAGRLLLEPELESRLGAVLTEMGHRAELWPDAGPDYFTNVSCACAVMAETNTGILKGAADPRRPGYAIGW
jgi:gamma-glutamyltranspeptidase/glutathione hydrolase